MKNTHWTYKVFYYTALSFALIGIISNFSTLTKTAIYQMADIDISSNGINLLGTSQAPRQNDDTEYNKKYIESGVGLVISIIVFYALYATVDDTKLKNASIDK